MKVHEVWDTSYFAGELQKGIERTTLPFVGIAWQHEAVDNDAWQITLLDGIPVGLKFSRLGQTSDA